MLPQQKLFRSSFRHYLGKIRTLVAYDFLCSRFFGGFIPHLRISTVLTRIVQCVRLPQPLLPRPPQREVMRVGCVVAWEAWRRCCPQEKPLRPPSRSAGVEMRATSRTGTTIGDARLDDAVVGTRTKSLRFWHLEESQSPWSWSVCPLRRWTWMDHSDSRISRQFANLEISHCGRPFNLNSWLAR